MWSAFITGFAGKTNELIEEKDDEIKKNMELQLKDMYVSRKEATKKAETRRDELRQAAAQLRSYGLEDAGIIKVLSSGNYETVSKLLENEATAGRLTPQKIKGFIGEADPNIPNSMDDFFNRATQLRAPAGTKPLSTEATGAFGFKSRAAEETAERFLKAQNISREDIQKTALEDMPLAATPLDYSVFATDKEKPKGVIELENRLADLASTMPGKTPAERMKAAVRTEEGQKIQAQIAGRNILELGRKQATKLPDEGSGSDATKPRTTEQINKIVVGRLDEAIKPLQLRGIRYVPEKNDWVADIPGSPEAKQLFELRQRIVRDVFEDAGLLKGNRLVDRNARDSIDRFAEVDPETLTIVSWRGIGDQPAPGQPEPGRGGQPPVPVPPRAEPAPSAMAELEKAALPMPLDRNGSIDFTALETGKIYRGKSGKRAQVWNGIGWQDPTTYTPPARMRR